MFLKFLQIKYKTIFVLWQLSNLSSFLSLSRHRRCRRRRVEKYPFSRAHVNEEMREFCGYDLLHYFSNPISIQHILRPSSFSISILSHHILQEIVPNKMKKMLSNFREHSMDDDGVLWCTLGDLQEKLSSSKTFIPTWSFHLSLSHSHQWLIDKTQDDTWSSIMIQAIEREQKMLWKLMSGI